MITVVVIPPNEPAYLKEIEPDDIAEMHRLVGGYFEALNVADDAYLWCNEEGKLLRLPLNPVATGIAVSRFRDVIVGTAILSGPPTEPNPDDEEDDGGEMTSATPRWVRRLGL